MDMMKMLGKVKEIQSKVKEAQENLDKIKVTGEAGAGMVKVTINGNKKILSVEIDDSLISKDSKEVLQDLIVAAVNKSIQDVEEKAKEEFKNSTEGFLPNIPGFDFGV